MHINADFSQRVLVHSDALDWVASPIKGVDRRMLDRIGDEIARATSIVRYAPNSHFSPHVHGGGEEFIVLEGVFQDEHGDFPAGSYIRNPPQSRHTPGSKPGCVIFVKLWQFDPDDRTQVRLRFDQLASAGDPRRPGVAITPLFSDTRENVRLETWAPGTTVEVTDDGGIELLVLEGGAETDAGLLRQRSWLRVPVGETLKAVATAEGARVWIKTGHLRFVSVPPAA